MIKISFARILLTSSFEATYYSWMNYLQRIIFSPNVTSFSLMQLFSAERNFLECIPSHIYLTKDLQALLLHSKWSVWLQTLHTLRLPGFPGAVNLCEEVGCLVRSSSHALTESYPTSKYMFAGTLFSSLLAQRYNGDFSEKQSSLSTWGIPCLLDLRNLIGMVGSCSLLC